MTHPCHPEVRRTRRAEGSRGCCGNRGYDFLKATGSYRFVPMITSGLRSRMTSNHGILHSVPLSRILAIEICNLFVI